MPLRRICALDCSLHGSCSIKYSQAWYSLCLGVPRFVCAVRSVPRAPPISYVHRGQGPCQILFHIAVLPCSVSVYEIWRLWVVIWMPKSLLFGEPQQKQVILPSSERTSFSVTSARRQMFHYALSCLKCFWRNEPFGGKVWEPVVQGEYQSYRSYLFF